MGRTYEKTWLLLDTNYLSHRAYYSTGGLAHGDIGTGVVFGVLRDVLWLQEYFDTRRPVFCFDLGVGLRQGVYEGYKGKRRKREAEADEDTLAGIYEFRQQVKQLRTDYLPAVGYRNIFAADGYEADDAIATTAKNLPETEEAIIISADHDLYQLLRPNVHIYHPQQKKIVTHESFRKAWGLEPWQWAIVKAMAGCDTDDVPGIAGVGEVTAAKYLRGELKETSAAYKKIRAGMGVVQRNRQLVKLPFVNTPVFEFQEDEVTQQKWIALADRLGMKSLAHQMPINEVPKGFGLEFYGKGRRLRA